jgi:hypothetical protein
MAPPFHDRNSDSSAPREPAQPSGFEGLPQEIQEHLRAELAATNEPGWLERYHAEVEARRLSGPKVVRKR